MAILDYLIEREAILVVNPIEELFQMFYSRRESGSSRGLRRVSWTTWSKQAALPHGVRVWEFQQELAVILIGMIANHVALSPELFDTLVVQGT